MEYKGKFRVYASGTSTVVCGLWTDGNGWCAVSFYDDGTKASGLYYQTRREMLTALDNLQEAMGRRLVGALFKPWALRLVGHD